MGPLFCIIVITTPTVGWGPLEVERARFKQIMALALPIIGGMGSQTLLNLFDTFMVSQLGKDAVAAVGLGGFAHFLASSFIIGLAAGVQAMASRRKGEGRENETAVPLNGGLLMVFCLATPLSIALFLLAPAIFQILNNDPNVVEIGSEYLQIRLLGMIAIGCNFSFRGYWNGVNMSRLYMRTLLFMHTSNAVISYILIFGAFGAPALGATGAAAGTAISTYMGTAYYFYLGWRHARKAGFLHGLPSLATMKIMLRLSIPSGVQQMFFAAGITALFIIIGMVGTNELAAANVLINIVLVAVLPGLGMGLAATSLVGQALGRRDIDDATKWGWDVARVAVMFVAVIALPMFLIPETLLEAFFHDEPVALALAALPLRLTGAAIPLDVMGLVFLNALIGSGATRMAMIVSITAQWVVFLPAAYLIGPVLEFGFMGIWIAQICYRSGQALVLAGLWRSRRWAGISL
ncbi:MAG: MATE family efflux transporter [Proteobacteria bacterium]|nr:MATE family efflux transporter [Pseudomonadota bacterium]